MRTETRSIFLHGMRDGFPIGMGYFAVSFSLGIIAAKAGLAAWMGFVGSFLTRASAGEYGVYSLIAIGASYVEVVAMCLVTNLRYLLMSTALSQKVDPDRKPAHRFGIAYFITDEIFAAEVRQDIARNTTPSGVTTPSSLPATAISATPATGSAQNSS